MHDDDVTMLLFLDNASDLWDLRFSLRRFLFFFGKNSFIFLYLWLMRVVFLFKYFFCTELRRCIITILKNTMVRYPIMVAFGVGVIYLTLQISVFKSVIRYFANTYMCNYLYNSLHHMYLINRNREKYRYIIFKAICVSIFTSDLSIHYWKLSA